MELRKSAATLITKRVEGFKLFLGVTRKGDQNDWGLPGGKADGDETYEQCAIRETQEETGLIVSGLIPVYTGPVKDGIYICTTFYILDYYKVEGRIRPEPGTDCLVDWVTKEQLLSGTFKEYNAKVFERYYW